MEESFGKMDKKTIGYSFLLLIIGSLGGIGVNEVMEKDNLFECKDRGIYWPCDGFSKYYGLENGKCINPELGNKVCRSGWVKVLISNSETNYTITETYECSPKECVRI